MPVTASSGGAGRHGEPKKNDPSSAVVPISTSTSVRAPGSDSGECGSVAGSIVGGAPRRVPRNAGCASSSSCSATTSSADRERKRSASNRSPPPASSLSASAQRTATSMGCARSPERRRLQDRAREQAVGPGRDEQVRRAQRARRLPGHGHPRGVAAETADVLAHPLERGDLIEQSPVSRGRTGAEGQIRMRKPAETPEPVVERDHHRIGGARQRAAVVQARPPRGRSRSRLRAATRAPAGHRRARE
jgi:hypothetical protein